MAAPGATLYSDSFHLSGINYLLAFIVNVTVIGAGTITIVPQTAVSDAADGDATQWIDCTLSEIYNFALGALNTSRGQIADFVLDKVRFKIVCSAGAGGTVVCNLLGDQPIT